MYEGATGYLPAALRCQRVRFSIFLCFFLRMRLRRFLISEPIRSATLSGVCVPATRVTVAAPFPGRLTVRQRFLVPRIGVRFLSRERTSAPLTVRADFRSASLVPSGACAISSYVGGVTRIPSRA